MPLVPDLVTTLTIPPPLRREAKLIEQCRREDAGVRDVGEIIPRVAGNAVSRNCAKREGARDRIARSPEGHREPVLPSGVRIEAKRDFVAIVCCPALSDQRAGRISWNQAGLDAILRDAVELRGIDNPLRCQRSV